MASSPIFFSFPNLIMIIIIFIFAAKITTAKASCTPSNCSPTGLAVKFPFQVLISYVHDNHLTFEDALCGYPGFQLSCQNNNSDPILSLPSSGDFAVKTINYSSQTLTVDDPGQCLPERFLGSQFSVSGTPFQVKNLGSFTFLNCSSAPEVGAGAGDKPVVVPCLSGDGYTVVAMPTVIFTSAPPLSMQPFCRVVSPTVWVPVTTSSEKWWLEDWGVYLRAYVMLTWRKPRCGGCELRGGDCRFVSDTDFEIGCFNLRKKHGLSKGVQYTFYFFAALVLLGFLCYSCRPKHQVELGNARVNRQPSTNISTNHPNDEVNDQESSSDIAATTAGIDATTIEMYPKTLIEESRRLPKSDKYYNSCPICLSEYQPKDMVRTLPNCFHYFHANCIDEWLRLNATCPICRNSPLVLSPASLSG